MKTCCPPHRVDTQMRVWAFIVSGYSDPTSRAVVMTDGSAPMPPELAPLFEGATDGAVAVCSRARLGRAVAPLAQLHPQKPGCFTVAMIHCGAWVIFQVPVVLYSEARRERARMLRELHGRRGAQPTIAEQMARFGGMA